MREMRFCSASSSWRKIPHAAGALRHQHRLYLGLKATLFMMSTYIALFATTRRWPYHLNASPACYNRYDYTCCKLPPLAQQGLDLDVRYDTGPNELWVNNYATLDRHDVSAPQLQRTARAS